MTADALLALANAISAAARCSTCSALVCAGWESMPGSFDRASLQRVGTLHDSADDAPTVAEYHPAGTHGWSNDAPIAIGWFPYNRCGVWQCVGCGRPFLHYTEVGGYYVDDRIREVQAHLVCRDAPAAPDAAGSG